MTVCRTLKKGIYIETNLDCANCGSKERVCTWQGECENLEPMTNEEYLRSANVNDMARLIATKLLELARHEYGIYDVVDYATVFEWLKEIHE